MEQSKAKQSETERNETTAPFTAETVSHDDPLRGSSGDGGSGNGSDWQKSCFQ